MLRASHATLLKIEAQHCESSPLISPSLLVNFAGYSHALKAERLQQHRTQADRGTRQKIHAHWNISSMSASRQSMGDAQVASPIHLSEQQICFVGTAPWLLCVCSLLVAAYPNTYVAYTSLQHPSAVGAAIGPTRSSACSSWLPDLMKVKVWRGFGSRCQSDITVATQLSIDRCLHTVMQAHS